MLDMCLLNTIGEWRAGPEDNSDANAILPSLMIYFLHSKFSFAFWGGGWFASPSPTKSCYPKLHLLQGCVQTGKFIVCSFLCEWCKFSRSLSWHSPQHVPHFYLHLWNFDMSYPHQSGLWFTMSVPCGCQRRIFRHNLAPTFAEHKQSSQVCRLAAIPRKSQFCRRVLFLYPPL